MIFASSGEAERVKAQFAADGIAISGVEPRRRPDEWFFLDTEADFKCSVGVGTGHAYDTVAPSAVFP